MGKLSKFDDVDVFASLSAILKQNTGFYQSDFDIDKSIITQAATSSHKEDKTSCGSAALWEHIAFENATCF